jgi:anti-sigma regulatory factor (Ser/Thr protein kinase)
MESLGFTEQVNEKRSFKASIDSISDVYEFVSKTLSGIDMDKKYLTLMETAVDEIFSNIAKYAYDGYGEVTIELTVARGRIEISFTDRGIPFDPLAAAPPDISSNPDDQRIGGLGIFIVKSTMDSVTYKRDGDRNVLALVKTIS